MISLSIPGLQSFNIDNLVLDVNGTLAIDGNLIPGVKERLNQLSQLVNIYMLTADTHGRQDHIDKELNLNSVRINRENEAQQKEAFVIKKGPESTIAIGNGANDELMIRKAAIGIVLIQEEGACFRTISSGKIVFKNIIHALDALVYPNRIIATLRR